MTARRRAAMVDAYRAALRAVDPQAAVDRHLQRSGSRVTITGEPAGPFEEVAVVALGKAAPAMARAAARVLGDLVTEGLVISDHPEPLPPRWLLVLGDHPFPGPSSLQGGAAALELARGLRSGSLLVVLVSGGGSALAEVPARGLHLEELVAVQRGLMAVGTPIGELNTVRRHLSRLKQGGLARAAAPASVVTLLVSDVVDGPPSDVASGPTLPDGTTPAQAADVVEQRLGHDAPPSIVERLRTARPALPPPPHPHVVVADVGVAARAAADRLTELGFPATVATTALRGEARVEAIRALQSAVAGITVLGGETVVTGAVAGLGGRNQEGALAAAIAMEGDRLRLFAALSTDGIDGPTEAAGAVVDGETTARGRAAGLDPVDHLRRHDSHSFLDATGDLVRTGPTGTNVGDLWMVGVGPTG